MRSIIFAVIAAFVIQLVSASPLNEQRNRDLLRERNDEADLDNKLYAYDTILNGRELSRNRRLNNENNNAIRGPSATANNWAGGLVESASSPAIESVASPSDKAPTVADLDGQSPEPDMEKLTAIAFNSREVKLVGPNQKEVEVKNDIGSKVLIVLDNLQKEATEVWDQVEDRLEKGWVDLRKMLTPKKSGN